MRGCVVSFHCSPLRPSCSSFPSRAPSRSRLRPCREISSTGGQSALSIAYVGPKTQIIGPRTLRGIACVDGAELQSCVTLKRGKKTATWTVLKPVKLMHQQAGDYTITLRKASELRDVFISGCGQVRATGTGTYSADGAAPVSYTPSDTTVVIDLKP